jgi:hypothetical protein
MGRACSTYGKGERSVTYRILVGKPEEGDNLEYSGVDGRIILKWIFKNLVGAMDWIDWVHDRDRWRALVNA